MGSLKVPYEAIGIAGFGVYLVAHAIVLGYPDETTMDMLATDVRVFMLIDLIFGMILVLLAVILTKMEN